MVRIHSSDILEFARKELYEIISKYEIRLFSSLVLFPFYIWRTISEYIIQQTFLIFKGFFNFARK